MRVFAARISGGSDEITRTLSRRNGNARRERFTRLAFLEIYIYNSTRCSAFTSRCGTRHNDYYRLQSRGVDYAWILRNDSRASDIGLININALEHASIDTLDQSCSESELTSFSSRGVFTLRVRHRLPGKHDDVLITRQIRRST